MPSLGQKVEKKFSVGLKFSQNIPTTGLQTKTEEQEFYVKDDFFYTIGIGLNYSISNRLSIISRIDFMKQPLIQKSLHYQGFTVRRRTIVYSDFERKIIQVPFGIRFYLTNKKMKIFSQLGLIKNFDYNHDENLKQHLNGFAGIGIDLKINENYQLDFITEIQNSFGELKYSFLSIGFEIKRFF